MAGQADLNSVAESIIPAGKESGSVKMNNLNLWLNSGHYQRKTHCTRFRCVKKSEGEFGRRLLLWRY
jgi:hypothetical protein